MTKLLLIFTGGGIGSLLRFGMSRWLNRPDAFFPWQTFSANLLASIFAGCIAGFWMNENENEGAKLLLLVGFCGGLSTFSTFSVENFNLLSEGKWMQAGVYSLLSVILCIGGTGVGYWISSGLRST